jgi:energy-converting hydrogenase Eha subunit A
MMTTVGLLAAVIVVEAVPVYAYLRAVYREEPIELGWPIIAAFGAVVVICGLATVLPLRFGLRRMEEFEF